MGTGPAGFAGAAGLAGAAAAGAAGFEVAGAAAAGFSGEAELAGAGGAGFSVVGLASPSGDGGTCGLLSSAILIVLSGVDYLEKWKTLTSNSLLKRCQRSVSLEECITSCGPLDSPR